MARLNDFAAPAESVEALKRRFVRQNRDIVRVNSIQSLRIRSLESEVSHLLAENVSLREQIINLTQEIERFESAKMLHDGVYEIKSRLDAKLAELSTLASDLGMLPRKVGKLRTEKAEADSDRHKATATESRPRTTDPPLNAGADDGRLPAIVEDKYYPRRTLEHQEIQNLVHAESRLESPQHIHSMHDDSDPVMESPSPELNDLLMESRSGNDTTGEEAFLPPTLETRKKKKKPDSATPASDPVSQSGRLIAENESEPTKSGSKRKFSPEDDGFLSDLAPEDDEFQFSRPSRSLPKQADSFDFMRQDLSPSKTPVSVKRGSTNSGVTKRKVLEPKSSNVNLGSPKKIRASLNPDHKVLPRAGADENTRSPQKPKDLDCQRANTLNLKPHPDRPATASHKQKRSSRSVETEESMQAEVVPKDSPMARAGGDLYPVSDMTAASRPSRRRGAVVSYAEPNLRDKMRRPTKSMIDAVAGNGSRRSSSFQLMRDSLGDEADYQPASTSAHPSLSQILPADGALSDRAADLVSQGQHSDQLLATVSRRKRKVSSSIKDNDDHPSSMSSSDASNLADLSKAPKETMGSRAQSRRHSSNPKSTSRDTSRRESDLTSDLDSSLEGDDIAGWKNSSAMDARYRRETRVAARRKSMMV
ncbi:uncharacterized protein N7482_007641 [Penicillium canariense]|uniref:Shugoshin n=1 Tax=Penicillium canariense TaxID=189055 RepID=A0A9W9LJB9_9EURO|nr:uncharacterized protein N7482_007641 [Penicillium canariense]KAJ5160637.1 hypothetical protein N7482_007641 [Penicillium canariense]